ncbi:hypothetical protein JCM11251_006799 [Rhodosporidiobolus azoricus]
MSSLFRSLCCCLPSSRGAATEDPYDEHQPLLNPDVLPQAPPRPANQRTTEQQREEQETLRRILHVASERLIPITAPTFLSSQPSSPAQPPHSDRAHSRNSSISTTSSSPTLTATPAPSSPSRSRPHSPSTYRAPTDAPAAPFRARVVHLGPGGEVLNPLPTSSPFAATSEGWDEAAPRRKGKRGSGRKSRPPSNHSMKTLPRSGGAYGAAAAGPSPLGRGSSSSAAAGEEGEGGYDSEGVGAEVLDGEEVHEEEGDGSRFDTIASYRTASSGRSRRLEGSTVSGHRLPGGYPRAGLRGLWAGQSEGGEGQSAELTAALNKLEEETQRWTLPDVGPVVGELGGGEEAA